MAELGEDKDVWPCDICHRPVRLVNEKWYNKITGYSCGSLNEWHVVTKPLPVGN